MREIVAGIQSDWERRRASVLATVVSVKGSSYRAAGAVLQVGSDLCFAGMISGGCLEPEVVELADDVRSGRNALRWYDLSDDSVWGLGMGCGGVVGVFLEPVAMDEHWAVWVKAIQKKEVVGRVVVYESDSLDVDTGSTLITAAGGRSVGTTGQPELDSALREQLETLMGQSEAPSRSVEVGPVRALLDVVWPPPRLVVFGAGQDAIPVCAMAQRAGFDVTVVDAREAFASPGRFAGADLDHSEPDDYADLDLGARHYVVIMQHHVARDAGALAAALDAGCHYVGLLGPEARFEKIQQHIRGQGGTLADEDVARVDTPIGLDIGARGPDEIALSIVSGLVAARRRAGQDAP